MSHLSGLPNTTYSSRSNLKVSPPNPYCKFFMLITVILLKIFLMYRLPHKLFLNVILEKSFFFLSFYVYFSFSFLIFLQVLFSTLKFILTHGVM